MTALLCVVGSFFLITAVDHVLGQNPSRICVTDFRFLPDRQLPQDWHLIVDSYSYDDLFGSRKAVWERNDVDGTGDQWHDSLGGQCRYEIGACTFQTPNQNNWFFTDFNSYDEAKEVIVNVTYKWSQCTQHETCSNDYATVYRYDTNGRVTTSQQTTPSNYVLLSGDLDGSRFQQNRSNLREPNLKLLSFTRPPNSEGLYLGFRDEGTCGQIIRILVYYKIAPEFVKGLLTCPEVPLVSGSSSSVTCSCADNASPPTGDLDRMCNDDGECSDPPTCECAPGYEFMSDNQSCIPCNMGMYKDGISNTERCRPCPANSEAPEQASAKCICLATFIRNESNPHDNCTQPPSSPRLTPRDPSVDGTFVTVCWTNSTKNGGLSDLHYNVYVYKVDDPSDVYRRVNREGIFDNGKQDSDSDLGELCFEVSGIDPKTSYSIVVTSANGATGDPDELPQNLASVEGRYVAFFVDTGEGGLRKSEAVAVTFFVTAIICALIATSVIVVIWFIWIKDKKGTQASFDGGHRRNTPEKHHDASNGRSSKSSPPTKKRPPPPPRPFAKV